MDGPAFPAPRAVSERLAARCPTLVLVVHGGPLEAKSALLAASLAQYYLPGRIVARVMEPEARWGALGPEARALFEGLGIPLVPAENRIDPDYPHGNKVAALEGISGPAVFLDSDMLLMCPFSWHPELGADIAAKPADIDTFSRGGGSWSRVWQLFNLETPAKSFTSTASREAMRPYFNAGFISVRDGDAFARMWVETVRRIDAEPRILNKRPWVDQIALPVTAARLGWEIPAPGRPVQLSLPPLGHRRGQPLFRPLPLAEGHRVPGAAPLPHPGAAGARAGSGGDPRPPRGMGRRPAGLRRAGRLKGRPTTAGCNPGTDPRRPRSPDRAACEKPKFRGTWAERPGADAWHKFTMILQGIQLRRKFS